MDYASIACFADVILQKKDPYNHHHKNVATILGDMLPYMEGARLTMVEKDIIVWGGHLHDIGKILLQDDLLNLPRRLTDGEMARVRNHVEYGYNIAIGAHFDPLICMMIRCHHERMDGSGYPRGIKGADIPIAARMLAVADTYDACCGRRPYRNPMSPRQAVTLIQAEVGTLFDELCVNALTKAIDVMDFKDLRYPDIMFQG
jgi:HD-GYP domain-containing protein (c-di-GMP phosphodiesterase class II)